MTYPSSSTVSAGQPTASSHYNLLRSDAIYLGQSASDSVALGTLLQRFEQGLRLEYLAVNRLRVPASAAEPVSLIVGGMMLQATANVDLPGGAAPSGPSAIWYVFAVKSVGSTSFTLDINTSPGESTTMRRIGSFYWNGTAIDQNSIHTETGDTLRSLLSYTEPLLCQGRLTLVSGNPVTVNDVSAAGTLYFTPFRGNQIALYSPLGWRLRTFAELELNLAGMAGGKNYDIFLSDQNGILTMQAEAWTADITRAIALSWQDGVAVKSGAPECRYLGTIRTSASGQSEDSQLKRFVWNASNRCVRKLRVIESTTSWTYTSRTPRPFNNNIANRLEVVLGLLEDSLQVTFCAFGRVSSSAFFSIGLGVDSTSEDDPMVIKNAGSSTSGDGITAVYCGLPGQAGYHYIQLLEIGGNSVTTTFFGNNGTGTDQAGACGFVMA